MICALCNTNEANKKNTHYLTDSIIRTCLNEDGSNVREKGFYFKMSSKTPYVNFNFQRGTSIQNLEETLGRLPTEDEIEKAKKIPYSVDFVFCNECEDIFTKIETPFIERILPTLREEDHEETNELELEDVKVIKMFFYLQIWRTSISVDSFKVNTDSLENLRISILNYEQLNIEDIPNFPIHLTYLNVVGEQINYTSNIICTINEQNSNIIIMNDFVLQFFENAESVNKIDFHGLYDYDNYLELVNKDNSIFKFKIFNNEERVAFILKLQRIEKVQKSISALQQMFVELWVSIFSNVPAPPIVDLYVAYLIVDNNDLLLLTEEAVTHKTTEFIAEFLR
ncbi:hypothetical protein MKS83_19555 [Chryseobacterium sp. Y16C]|uniref:hypothetical protein n=1 Tax=Chryseobacterium sp. Y16C TaxID=2920939 RepID=UPI001F0A7F94|nr:hypothetical protein [Chryseobacterium sp. Y16C]UMQ41569.1 hypothetical protein MKS83_19555 [Chryseobacterium sp. Y16C]